MKKSIFSKQKPAAQEARKNTVGKPNSKVNLENEELDELPIFRKEPVDEKSKLEFAKIVLLVVLVLYGALVCITLLLDPSLVKEVWTFTTFIINTTIAMVLGYYFGRRQ